MKFARTILLFSVFFVACQTQQTIVLKKINKSIKVKIDSSDLTRLEQSSIPGLVTYSDAEGNFISLVYLESEEGYVKTISHDNSLWREAITYYKSTLFIKSREITFDNVGYGKTKFYDQNGLFTHEIDEEQGFNFKIDNLISMLKTSYNIDLNKFRQRQGIRRYIDDQSQLPTYQVSYPLGSKYRQITIDGTNGAILADEIKIYID